LPRQARDKRWENSKKSTGFYESDAAKRRWGRAVHGAHSAGRLVCCLEQLHCTGENYSAPFLKAFEKLQFSCARCQWFTKTGSGQTQRKLTIELCVSCTQASIYFNRGLPMDLQVRKNALLAASFFLKTVGCQDRLRDQVEKKSSKRKDRFGGSADVRRPARPQRLELHDERSQCERGPRGARAGV
jgi:hypothetical protein